MQRGDSNTPLRQRPGAAGRQRHVDPGELQHGKAVARSVLERVVAVDGRDTHEVEMSRREENGHRIVVSGIAIDQDLGLGHAFRLRSRRFSLAD